jgi:hypothetical protein
MAGEGTPLGLIKKRGTAARKLPAAGRCRPGAAGVSYRG